MSFIKLITESFQTTDKKCNVTENTLTIKDLDNLILECTNNLINIKAKYEDLKSTWRSLKEDLQSFSFYNHINSGTNMKEQFQKAIDDLKMDYRDTQATLNRYKEQKNKLLLEYNLQEPITDNNNLKDKYSHIVEETQSMIDSSNIYDIFEYLFNELVPKYGKSETKAGEIIRALMRIMYGAYNDSQVFYEGDGKDLFGNAARFLKDMGYGEYLDKAIDLIGDAYIDAMEIVIENIVRDLISDQIDSFYTENNIDYENITLKEQQQ